MNKWAELLVGVILLIGLIVVAWASSVYSWTIFGKDFNILNSAWIFLKGGFFWFLALIAILFIMLGISDLKE